MTTFAVIATGESMSQELADRLQHLPRIAINDAFRIAPDADALCANDAAWWRENPDARSFKGRRFSTATLPEVEQVQCGAIQTSSNSALLGLHVGLKVYGWTRALLYGIDLQGTHYFGPHKTLKNTNAVRFEVFKQQFERYAKTLNGVEVFNASPNSALRCFPFL